MAEGWIDESTAEGWMYCKVDGHGVGMEEDRDGCMDGCIEGCREAGGIDAWKQVHIWRIGRDGSRKDREGFGM